MTRIGVVGAGGIGRIHAELLGSMTDIELAGICDVDSTASGPAERLGVPFVSDTNALVDLGVDGVIISVPNQLHLEVGSFFANGGVHILVEKPLADTVAAGRELVDAASRCGVELLVGQHRRYNNLVREARRVVDEQLGSLVAVNAMVTMKKPDSYYEPAWRRGQGAGPLLVNLIHEVDLLRAVCGEITSVQAVAGRVGRSFAFDDTGALLLTFANGALGTIVVTESTPSPWSWEGSVSEGMGFHNAGRDYLRFVGKGASLSFPSMTLWNYDTADGEPGWRSPLLSRRIDVVRNNPYVDQIRHFVRVIEGMEAPEVSGMEGLRSVAVVAAVIEASRSGTVVDVERVLGES